MRLKMKTKKKETSSPKDPEVKRQAKFSLQLTRFELLHLRDLMAILLPPDGAQTVSQALAASEDRTIIESMLWDKVSKLCMDANLPVESEAPDYIIAPLAPPPMGVFQLNHDLSSPRTAAAGFLPEEKNEEEQKQKRE